MEFLHSFCMVVLCLHSFAQEELFFYKERKILYWLGHYGFHSHKRAMNLNKYSVLEIMEYFQDIPVMNKTREETIFNAENLIIINKKNLKACSKIHFCAFYLVKNVSPFFLTAYLLCFATLYQDGLSPFCQSV